jgi:putative cell wall-binding protein
MRFKSRSRALLGSALAATLGLAGLALAASPASAEPAEIIRVAGADRYGTAADAATDAYPDGSANVVLASGERFPDALAGGGLAGSLDAPILLTMQNTLPAATIAALDELDAENVTILGGTEAVSPAVATALTGAGYSVDRVAGVDRFATAAEIAEELGGTTAVLANGMNFPDALAISPGAHALELPLLLTMAGTLHPQAASYIDGNDVDTVIIVGGTDVVSQSIQNGLESDGIDVVRLAGVNRYETSVEIAEFHTTVGFDLEAITLATGENFPDALAGGPFASQMGAPMVLTQSNTLTGVTREFIEDNAEEIDTIYVLGGTAAISNAVAQAAAAAADAGDEPGVNPTATTRPELVSAQIIQTTTQGTTVRFNFDEALTGSFIDEENFYVYSFGWNGQGAGYMDMGDNAQIVSGNTSQVNVRFPNITSAAAAAGLSVATVDEDAVRGVSGAFGDRNVIGDAALNPGATSQLTARRTEAPDLVSVTNFRPDPGNSFQTLVTYTFDEPAWNDCGDGGYFLNHVDGVNWNDDSEVVAGNGTAVHTVAFQNNGFSGGAPSTVNVAAASIARAGMYEGCVNDAQALDGNDNPLQTVNVSNNGITETPDLLSAIVVRNSPTPAALVPTFGDTIDSILYTFDEPVLLPSGTPPGEPSIVGLTGDEGFYAYLSTSEQLEAAIVTRSTANDTQVAAIFGPGGTLDLAVGASVDWETVEEGSGGQNRGNLEHEVGVANVGTGPTTISGRTAAPDLIDVTVAERRDAFGTLVGARVTYTFDEDVFLLEEGRFGIVLADGVQYWCDDAYVGTTEDTDNTVICDSFDGSTTTQSLSAVVGIVDDSAVANQLQGTGPGTATPGGADGGDRNVEGSEVI